MKVPIFIFLIGFSIISNCNAIRLGFTKDELEQKIEQTTAEQNSLWNGKAGNYSIKAISNLAEGDALVIKEVNLNNVVWAKMELNLGIGSVPTLFYMDEKHGKEIQHITCSNTSVI